jgi:cardiolipin synthase
MSISDTSPWFDVDTDRVRLLRDGAAAYPAMIESITTAQSEILLEMYWIGADRIGALFRDAIAERARAGVLVRVIYDALGSLGVSSGFWDPVIDAGGHVHAYHSVSPIEPSFRFADVELRDHRKLLVVDGKSGFTGGINIGLPWASIADGGAGWRDDMVEARGPVVDEMRALFYRTWGRISRLTPPRDLVPLSKKHPRRVWMLASQRGRLRSIHREYVVRIARARRTIEIANSYFIPDRSVRNALFRAVARGVRVRVVVPARGDVPLVQYAQEAMFDTLLRHGVEIFVFEGQMMHAKTAIIDGEFATIGSYNLDERSWRKNLELNIAIEDEAFAKYASEWFEHDVGKSRALSLSTWRARSMSRRGAEWVAFAMRRLW